MKLTIMYDDKDFFGYNNLREDTTKFATKADAKKAFSYLRKHWDASVKCDCYVFKFESYSDFEEDVLSILQYDSWNHCTKTKVPFHRAKKLFYDLFSK